MDYRKNGIVNDIDTQSLASGLCSLMSQVCLEKLTTRCTLYEIGTGHYYVVSPPVCDHFPYTTHRLPGVSRLREVGLEGSVYARV